MRDGGRQGFLQIQILNLTPDMSKKKFIPALEFSIPKQDATRCRVLLFDADEAITTDWQREMAMSHGEFNSHGFRGNEFQEQKHDVDFRIFAVGGSTTYGGAADR